MIKMNDLEKEETKLRISIQYTLVFVSLLWLVKLLEWVTSMDLAVLGIYPRTLAGSVGIVTSPFIHGDFLHLFSNTFPLVFLGIGTIYFYRHIAIDAFIAIYLITGTLVWLLARNAYHIGASGLVYGLVSFLFFSGILRKDIRAVAISLVVVFFYGGMIYGIFPTKETISWESHLLGSIAGFFIAFMYRKKGITLTPPISEKKATVFNQDVPKSKWVTTSTIKGKEGISITYTYRKKDKSSGSST